jgi:hypothetical protein
MTRPFQELMRITGATKKHVPSSLEPGGLLVYTDIDVSDVNK